MVGRVLAALLLLSTVGARKFLDPLVKLAANTENLDASKPWIEKWFTVKLDHFTYSDTNTFQMKWLWNNTYYKPGGPIFFYTGNEGDIETFVTATGMMWDLAPQFHAAIIFAEHRFYGATQPFGNLSYATISNMGYLTSEQALADYAALLYALKDANNTLGIVYPSDTPVIAFGGSYGGMLSAWFRMKYPHLITGAWAASAPLLYFRGGGVDQGGFDAVTTRTYVEAGCNRYIVANSWNAILNLSSTDEGREFLNTQFKIDPKSQINSTDDGWNLNYYFREAIEYMAMVDYPYGTGFLMALPGWPVNEACKYMNTPGTNFTDRDLATRMYQASNVYYNSTGTLKYNCIDQSVCGDTGTSGLGEDAYGWPWQECSEIIMDMCARGGNNDFFWNECGGDSIALLAESCNATFGSFNWNTNVWNIDAVSILYGLSVTGASNIILTQGHLDPWSSGGFKASSAGVSEDRGIYVMEIPGSAHHLDLRTPNTCDPNTVANARYQIVRILECWVNGCTTPRRLTELPVLVAASANAACKDLNNKFPWGQSDSSAADVNALVVVLLLLAGLLF
ncbi:hypothetical protein Q1695_015159 [Nippostrongylus brasiliensis]|nr:hypothetical protein Q1695_015159 [Nippostrongylus brasiliensis]